MIISGATLYNVGYVVDTSSSYTPSSANLVYNLDAANYSAVPTNGSTDATGTYTITVANSGAISWNSANGGVFRSSATVVGTDYITGGPNYVSSAQSYSVFMAYKYNTAGAQGRLLNTTVGSPDWLMGTYSGPAMNVWYPNGTINLSSDVADNNWHFIWGTGNQTTGVMNLYIATTAAPAAVYKTLTGSTGAAFNSSRGFNQLRLFSRVSNSEQVSADVGFVKVYDNALSLTDIQGLWSQYRTRFGY
jgi:hypothetical protein